MLPFAAVQRVRVTCPHCNTAHTRLAAGVKRGMKLRCEQCRRVFEVRAVESVIGSAKR